MKRKTRDASDEKRRSPLACIIDYAGNRKWLVIFGCVLSALSMLVSFGTYICIWFVARDLIAAAPDWESATGLPAYGWWALGFTAASIALYFAALICTHLAAFRCSSNIRTRCIDHLMETSLGYFDTHATGALRRVVDGCASETEGLVAHKLPDAAGSAAMVVGMVALFLFFDWRLGLACLLSLVIAVLCMAWMMRSRGMDFLMRYQEALVRMSKTGTEYVRGIPVVKVFQQTVYSFRAFYKAIRDFSDLAREYAVKGCETPQSVLLTAVSGIAIFLVPAMLLIAPDETDLISFLADFSFYTIFSAIIPTAITRVMFMSEAVQMAQDALTRVNEVLTAPVAEAPAEPRAPLDNSIEFRNVTFSYENADKPALNDLSFHVPAGATVALVGPSGGGKTTAASLVPRFWDADKGAVLVGGVDVKQIDPTDLMDHIAFVFQTNRLFTASVLENVRAARPDATREQALAALSAAQCDDIIAKLPQGVDTVIGPDGTYLSGGEVQRLMIARAILKDAPIVVLDEATAFADPENEVLIQRALKRLARGSNGSPCTALIIAHRLSTVRNADSIVVLDQGRAVEQGTHDELISAGGLYARMWHDYEQAVAWRIDGSGNMTAADTGNVRCRYGSCKPSPDHETDSGRETEQAPALSRGRLAQRYALSDLDMRDIRVATGWTIVANLMTFAGAGILLAAIAQLVACAVEGAAFPDPLPYAIALVVFALALFVAEKHSYRTTYGAVYEGSARQRIGLAERLRKLPLSYFGQGDVADFTETIMADVKTIEQVRSNALPELYAALITLGIAAIGLISLNWQLAVAALWSAPVAFALLFAVRRLIEPLSNAQRTANLRVSESIQEALECVREIRATNRVGAYLESIHARIKEAEAQTVRSEVLSGVLVNGVQIVLRLGLATTVLVGSSSVASGQADFFTLFLFLIVVSRIYAPFDQCLTGIAQIFGARTAADRIRALYEEPIATGSDSFEPCGHDVTFENVSFSYGKGRGEALSHVSFVAREGEVTALVGPSGSGKSTCSKLACRFWDPTSGHVLVGDIDAATVDPETLLCDFAVVFQDVVLFDDTVMGNIRLGRRDASDEEVLAAARAANCDSFVERMPQGYNTMIGENGSRLSGGERQRISIARALLKDAPIVVLDEATASLDVENETEVQAALSRLLMGKTVIVIAHRMRTVERADHVVVLDGGHVVEQGSPNDLMARDGLFARMVRLQNESADWTI